MINADFPIVGDSYWYITCLGTMRKKYHNDTVSRFHKATGNAHKTEAGALGYLELLKSELGDGEMLGENTALKEKLKEASEFIQKLGPTIDYDIVSEIEEMLR